MMNFTITEEEYKKIIKMRFEKDRQERKACEEAMNYIEDVIMGTIDVIGVDNTKDIVKEVYKKLLTAKLAQMREKG